MKKHFIFFIFLILSLSAFCGQGALLRGNKAYDAGKYGEAFEQYQKAAAGGLAQKAQYNSGAALYKLQDYDAAAEAYASSAEQQGSLKESAYFNLGNAYFRAKKNDEAEKSYRAALKINPQDKDALHNLQIILRQKQQQQNDKQCSNPQQQENNDKNSSGGDKEQNKENQQSQNKDNQNRQDKSESGEEENKDDGQKQNSPGEPRQNENGITQDQADAILRMAMEKESGENDKNAAAGGGVKSVKGQMQMPEVEKDW